MNKGVLYALILSAVISCQKSETPAPTNERKQPAEKRPTEIKKPEPKVPTWDKEPTGFRGLEFGSSQAAAKKLFGSMLCFNHEGDKLCTQDFMLGSAKVEGIYRFSNNRFVKVLLAFDISDYENLRDVFMERYGPPSSSSNSTVENSMGAKFQDEDLSWSGKQVEISLTRISDKVTKGTASILVKEWWKSELQQMESKRKEAADEL